jgi:hypothetical protein
VEELVVEDCYSYAIPFDSDSKDQTNSDGDTFAKLMRCLMYIKDLSAKIQERDESCR